MADRLPTPPAPSPDWAYFLDFDGTLVEISATPDGVSVSPALAPLLTAARDRTSGALALVTGRPLEEIDRFLAPFQAAAAAQHGGQRRRPDGSRDDHSGDPALVDAARALHRFAAAHPGTLVEEKGLTLTLHYRGAPDIQPQAERMMTRIAEDLGPDFKLLFGKMVLEVKPATVDKGRAIEAFLSEPPFRGRRPVMIGDDRTDEDGFRAVEAVGGISIRVGDPDGWESCARYRLEDPDVVHGWLEKLTALA